MPSSSLLFKKYNPPKKMPTIPSTKMQNPFISSPSGQKHSHAPLPLFCVLFQWEEDYGAIFALFNNSPTTHFPLNFWAFWVRIGHAIHCELCAGFSLIRTQKWITNRQNGYWAFAPGKIIVRKKVNLANPPGPIIFVAKNGFWLSLPNEI